jgi:Protein of unknown function (DUF3107)
VELKIGVQQTARELTLEMDASTDRGALKESIATALAEDNGVLWLTDAKGREVCVPAGKIAYVELSPAIAERRIGFGG